MVSPLRLLIKSTSKSNSRMMAMVAFKIEVMNRIEVNSEFASWWSSCFIHCCYLGVKNKKKQVPKGIRSHYSERKFLFFYTKQNQHGRWFWMLLNAGETDEIFK